MVSETGIRPGHRYEYRLVIDGTTKASGTIDLTAEKGDPIQNGGMEDWSTTTLGSNKNIVYPNASGNSFWTSGNNGQTTGLCTKNENIWLGNTSGSYCAYLKPNLTSIGSIKIFAAGNLFTGSFDYTVSIFGWSGGTASFGFALRWDCTSHGATGQSQGDGRQHSDPGGEEERAVHLGHLPRTHLRMYLRPGHPNRQRIPDQGA